MELLGTIFGSIFSGGATTVAQHARIEALCAEAMTELQRVRRFSK